MRKEHLHNEEELQSYFVRRIERFLNAQGRTLIGWDEILEGHLAAARHRHELGAAWTVVSRPPTRATTW